MLLACPFRPASAQQLPDAPPDSVEASVVDSLQASLDRFKRAQPPSAADSARLRRWADSVQASGVERRQSEPSRAQALLRRSLDGYRALKDTAKIADVIGDIGEIHEEQGDYGRALEHFRTALELWRKIDNQSRIASALNRIGLVHYNQGRYDETLTRYRKSLEIQRATDDRQGVASALIGIGMTYFQQGRYDQALDYSREALAVFRELDARGRVANALIGIGMTHYRQGRYDEALPPCREALEIYQELGDQRGLANALNNIGVIYESQDRQSEALDSYREALATYQELGNQYGIAASLNNIGEIHGNRGRYEKALSRYQESLEIARDIGDRQGVAATLSSIGGIHKEQGRLEEALTQYRASLAINQEIGARSQTVHNLENIGEVHLQEGRLGAATDTLGRSVHLAERLRQSATSPEARRSLLSTQIDAYQGLTTAHVRLEQPDSALRSVEQARARLLADRLAGTAQGDTTFSIPSSTQLRQTLGPREVALLYGNVDPERPLTVVIVTREATFARELPDSTVRAGIETAYPTLLNRLRREEGPLSEALGAAASATETEETLPSLAEAIRLYRYHLVRSGPDASVQKDLARRLSELLIAPVAEQLAGADKLTVVPTGALGYLPFETLRTVNGSDKAISDRDPSPQDKRVTGDERTGRDATDRYLVENKQVRYTQSLTVLRQLQGREHPERAASLLAFGGARYESEQTMEDGALFGEGPADSVRISTGDHASTILRSAETQMERGRSPRLAYLQLGYRTWGDLPGTREEVTEIGAISGLSSTVVSGRQASEDTIRAMSERGTLANYRYLHFATHGVAVPEAPKLSALVLSQTNASDSLAARDGYLTMEEIAGLEMQADVAVLSACQTGLGKVVAGEGVVSLSHAFLRAGANATLVSQWKVLDASTRQFMTAVYKRAKAEGTSFAEAVTETKRAFIAGEHGEKNTDPLRWAPFVYYGRE